MEISALNPYPLLTTSPSTPHSKPLFFPHSYPLPVFVLFDAAAAASRYLLLSVLPETSHLPPPSSPMSSGRSGSSPGCTPLLTPCPPPVRIASSAIIVVAAAAAGYGLGSRLGGSRNATLGGDAAAGAAYAVNPCVPEVAVANLHNYAVGCSDPGAIKKEDVEAIANKYGVSKQNEAFNAELCNIYCRFVSAVLPPGGENLKGHEVDTIIKFKNSLGIDDPDAAAMHTEIGRRIFRDRLETGDRDSDMDQRRAFQKLVYVSNLVFGDASGFLLPWKRVFKVTDAQVEVAGRDNAQRLYAIKLKPISQDLNVDQLVSLREQLLY